MIDPIVDVDWLREHGDEVVVADVRWYLDGRDGARAFEDAHLPGAVFVDLERWLAGPASPDAGRHPLPDPAVFADGMARCGIGDDTVVVAYDDQGGVIAARLVWMLRATHHAAALLDGGIAAWTGPLASGPSAPRSATFAAHAWPVDRLATIDEASGGGGVVLDARDPVRYRGEQEPIDPRAGHIPGARNVPCREHLDGAGRLRPLAEIRDRFRAAGAHEGADVISYCGSGVTACHNLLVLEHAGLGRGRLFPGSWSQYSADPARRVATGTDAG